MKNTAVILFLLFVVLSHLSCEKEAYVEKEYTYNYYDESDTCTKVIDTLSLVVGSYNKMNVISINERLDLANSEKDSDSLLFWLNVKNETKAQIKVLKDSLQVRATDGSIVYLKRVGIYFTQLDLNLCFGSTSDYTYAFQKGDTLNLQNMEGSNYQPNCYYAYGRTMFMNSMLGIEYNAHNKNWGSISLHKWYSSSFTEKRFGEGYLCFRFLDGDVIKYGWLKLNIESCSTLEIIELAYMK